MTSQISELAQNFNKVRDAVSRINLISSIWVHRGGGGGVMSKYLFQLSNDYIFMSLFVIQCLCFSSSPTSLTVTHPLSIKFQKVQLKIDPKKYKQKLDSPGHLAICCAHSGAEAGKLQRSDPYRGEVVKTRHSHNT